MRQPKWADRIIDQLIEKEGLTLYPSIKWSKSRANPLSYSGTTYHKPKRITLRIGKRIKIWEKKLILLHELTHWLTDDKEGHTQKFWDKAFELYRHFNLPMHKVACNEANYKKTAHYAYLKNRKQYSLNKK